MERIRGLLSRLPALPKLSRSKATGVVGIDIGSSSIKLVEITETPTGYQLSRMASKPLRQGVIKKGLMEDGSAVMNTIKDLIKETGCTAKLAATALSGHSVLINKATFKEMEEDELRQTIVDEADEYMPIDRVENIYFDIHILGANENNAEQIDVIIAAAKNDIIAEYRSAVERAGVRMVLMDVDAFALETAYEENYDFADEDVVALVHIGAALTNINIVKGGQSVFTRNVLMGGDLITESVQSRRGGSFEEAEAWKISHSNGGGILPEESLQGESLVMLADPILAEIERSIDFFISSAGMIFINKVLLSGGSSFIPGIMDDLTQRLRCDVELFDPFKALEYDKKTYSPEYIREMSAIAPIAVGLAMRKSEDL
ncbi:MAG: type IV pilus assembly protein PilM [Syntrophales bacterium]|nr:type IV pilus assembly protein PilM [Syntrophales bacterium]